jgi:hypothetical protein
LGFGFRFRYSFGYDVHCWGSGRQSSRGVPSTRSPCDSDERLSEARDAGVEEGVTPWSPVPSLGVKRPASYRRISGEQDRVQASHQ